MPFLDSFRSVPVCLLALLGGLACQPPNLSVPLAPLPSPEQARIQAESQIRVLPLPKAQVFPKVLEVLMDMGFHIRCADEALGQVNIYQAWEDPRYSADPHFSMEATLLFLDAAPGTTRVRMAGTGHWNVWVSGKTLATTAQGTMPALSPEDCREFLDRLQARLCPRP
ncbi:MAG: hypothetical protein P4L11_10960 [Geothrix sp.]|nr:hypothetical protein [Geothrix sp.]